MRSNSQVNEHHPAYTHPPVQHRTNSSGHVPLINERERSLSVSPKTQVGVRKPSGEQTYGGQDPHSSHRGSFSEARSSGHSMAGTHHLANGQPVYANNSPHVPPQQLPHQSNLVQRPLQDAIKHEQSRAIQPAIKQESQPQEHLTLQQPISNISNMDSTKLKRRAESPAAPQDQKKVKVQPTGPPVWARLHPTNPGYHRQRQLYPRMGEVPEPVVDNKAVSQPPTQVSDQASTHAPVETEAVSKKVKTTEILGVPWELSVTGTLPADHLMHHVAEFLYITMLSHPDLGAGGSKDGALEIEAKVGTLVDKNENDRLKLPVTTPCALHEGFSKSHVRFESFITEVGHSSLTV